MDQADLARIALAVKKLPSVRRPLPATVDQVSLQRDLKQLNEMISRAIEEPAAILSYLTEVVVIQRLFFNRGLRQMTAASLVDTLVVALPAEQVAKEDLMAFASAMTYLCQLLTKQQLSPVADLEDEFLLLLIQRRPDLLPGVAENKNSELQNGLRRHFFDTPVVLLSGGLTPFFVQMSITKTGLNFNELLVAIDQIQDPALQFATLALFVNVAPTYRQILQIANQVRQPHPNKPSSQPKVPALAMNYLCQQNEFSPAAVTYFVSACQSLVDFCSERQAWTAQQTHKIWSQIGPTFVASFYLDTPTMPISKLKEVLLPQLFVGSDQRMVASTDFCRILQDYPWEPLEPLLPEPSADILTQPLNDQQLAAELAQARQELAHLTSGVAPHDLPALPQYEQFVLTLHQKMVKKYHRRLAQWTDLSFTACLKELFTANPELVAQQPALLRFLQLYLFSLDDHGLLKDVDDLFNGLIEAASQFVVAGLNHLAEMQLAD